MAVQKVRKKTHRLPSLHETPERSPETLRLRDTVLSVPQRLRASSHPALPPAAGVGFVAAVAQGRRTRGPAGGASPGGKGKNPSSSSSLGTVSSSPGAGGRSDSAGDPPRPRSRTGDRPDARTDARRRSFARTTSSTERLPCGTVRRAGPGPSPPARRRSPPPDDADRRAGRGPSSSASTC